MAKRGIPQGYALKLLAPNGKTAGIPNWFLVPFGIGTAALGLYLAHSEGYLDSLYKSLSSTLSFSDTSTPTTKAQRVIFNVYPPVIKPFRRIKLRGTFEDNQGVIQPVNIGYYAIFENVQAGAYAKEGRLMVSRGVLGQGISNFDVNVPTDNFRPGPYTVYVSNKPIIDDPLRGKAIELELVGRQPLIIG